MTIRWASTESIVAVNVQRTIYSLIHLVIFISIYQQLRSPTDGAIYRLPKWCLNSPVDFLSAFRVFLYFILYNDVLRYRQRFFVRNF